jgi:aryl-alcohol dehydrogenase-like predicted oxidoreductase
LRLSFARMLHGQLPGIALPVPRLILGTARLPSPRSRLAFWKKGSDEAVLDEAFSLGFRALDTAAVYGHGESERFLGRWMKERRNRPQLILIGKGGHPDASGNTRLGFRDLAVDLESSLQRLQTDRLDLYLLHRDDPSLPVGPMVEALHSHVKAGRVSAIGASNWSHTRIAEANAFAHAHGLTPFSVSSPQYGLAVPREPPWPGCLSIGGNDGASAREAYAQSRLAILPWSTLGGGFFSGRADAHGTHVYGTAANIARLDRAQQLGQRKGVSASQVALAWTLTDPLQPFPIVACGSTTSLRQNLEALRLRLTEAERAWVLTGEGTPGDAT